MFHLRGFLHDLIGKEGATTLNRELKQEDTNLFNPLAVNQPFSNKSTIISFIMSILVVSIHANNLKYYGLENELMSLSFQVEKLFADVMGKIAVPFFFMMSGYWYFRMNIHSLDVWDSVKRKNRKRIISLVVPYILWNAIGTAFYMFITRVPFLANNMNNSEVIPITLETIFLGVVLHKYYYPFWFLRELILMTFVVTPVLVLVLKSKPLSQAVLICLCALSCLGISSSLLNTSSVLLYFLGGYLSVYQRENIENKSSKKSSIAALIAMIICCLVRYFGIPVLGEFCTYISPILLLRVTDLIDFKKPTWFGTQSFFIYAAHVIPVTVVGHLLKTVSSHPLWAAASYLLAIGITMLLLYLTAKLLYKVIPKLYMFVSGGR